MEIAASATRWTWSFRRARNQCLPRVPNQTIATIAGHTTGDGLGGARMRRVGSSEVLMLPRGGSILFDHSSMLPGGAAELAVVEMVSVDCAVAVPGVTVGGSNVQLAAGGKLPLAQLSVI